MQVSSQVIDSHKFYSPTLLFDNAKSLHSTYYIILYPTNDIDQRYRQGDIALWIFPCGTAIATKVPALVVKPRHHTCTCYKSTVHGVPTKPMAS